MLLRLFPNLKRIVISCGYDDERHYIYNNHPVSISSLCATFPEQALSQHEHTQQIRVEAIYVSKETITKEQAQSDYNKFAKSFVDGNKDGDICDSLGGE